MTQRLIAFLVIAGIAVVALYVGTREHRPQNAGLPLVHAAAPVCVPPAVHWQFKQRRIA